MTRGRVPGAFRFRNARRSYELRLDPDVRRQRRIRGIIDSIQDDLDNGGTACVRQILRGPRELYRLELERPDLAYQRTTILDRETLTTLLERTPEDSLRARLIIR
jgi:hypothetical protein